MSGDGLVAFLRARLDEDEAAAMAASDSPWTPWRGRPGLGLPGLEHAVALPGQDSGSPVSIATASWLDAEHIALHDPDRALREVAAGRRILDRYEDCLARMEDPNYPAGVARDQAREYEDFVLPNLACAWNDHPDYDPDWEP